MIHADYMLINAHSTLFLAKTVDWRMASAFDPRETDA